MFHTFKLDVKFIYIVDIHINASSVYSALKKIPLFRYNTINSAGYNALVNTSFIENMMGGRNFKLDSIPQHTLLIG
jgi:hypothetical protein